MDGQERWAVMHAGRGPKSTTAIPAACLIFGLWMAGCTTVPAEPSESGAAGPPLPIVSMTSPAPPTASPIAPAPAASAPAPSSPGTASVAVPPAASPPRQQHQLQHRPRALPLPPWPRPPPHRLPSSSLHPPNRAPARRNQQPPQQSFPWIRKTPDRRSTTWQSTTAAPAACGSAATTAGTHQGGRCRARRPAVRGTRPPAGGRNASGQ